MRITYLHQYFNTPEMAGGTRSYEMARRLVAKGHEVNMVTSWREPNAQRDWYETDEAGIHVHWLPVPYSNHMSYRERIHAFFRFAWRAARKAASIPADVIFATSTPLTIALPGVYAKSRRKVPMVFEVRDLWPEVPIAIGALRNPVLIAAARILERFAYINAVHVVALAPGMREGVASTGYDPENISVIPNAADLAEFSQCYTAESSPLKRWRPEAGKLILYTGTIGEVNGVDYIVRFAYELEKQYPGDETRFVILGDGKKCQEIKRLADTLKVRDRRVFFVGSVPKNEIPDWLQICDATIMTYNGPEMLYKDSVSNKFFDSIASGRPVIANFRGFSTLVAEHYEAGLVLPNEDVENAVRRYYKWVTNPEACENAGKAARNLAETMFGRDLMADRLDIVLQNAGSRERGSVPVGREYVDLWNDVKASRDGTEE